MYAETLLHHRGIWIIFRTLPQDFYLRKENLVQYYKPNYNWKIQKKKGKTTWDRNVHLSIQSVSVPTSLFVQKLTFVITICVHVPRWSAVLEVVTLRWVMRVAYGLSEMKKVNLTDYP